jgi:hypothetical protein
MTLKLSKSQRKGIDFYPVEQAVYVPSTKNIKYPISRKQYNKRVDEVRDYLSDRFGGYTSIRGIGGYKMGKRLVKENVVKVVSFSTRKDFREHKPELIKKLKSWGKKWGQNSMGYEYEGDLYYFPKAKGRKK